MENMKVCIQYRWDDADVIRTRQIIRAVGVIPIDVLEELEIIRESQAYLCVGENDHTQYNYISPFSEEFLNDSVRSDLITLDQKLREHGGDYVYSHIDISSPTERGAETELLLEIKKYDFHFVKYNRLALPLHIVDMLGIAEGIIGVAPTLDELQVSVYSHSLLSLLNDGPITDAGSSQIYPDGYTSLN